jgi:hypothetical protein
VIAIVLIVLQVYQIYVNYKDYFISLTHHQITLFYFSILSNIYLFCTMGLMTPDLNKQLVPNIEIFRIIKFLFLFQFFVHKAKGLYETKYLN